MRTSVSRSRNIQKMLSLHATRVYTSGVCRRYSTTEGLIDSAAYCRELVRKHDYESFLIGKLWPVPQQDGYFAIKAFSVCGINFVVLLINLCSIRQS